MEDHKRQRIIEEGHEKRASILTKKFERDVQRICGEWVKERLGCDLNPGNLKETLYYHMDKAVVDIVAGMIGFESRWGRWEVDHCNGRMSRLGDYLKSNADQWIRDWVDAHIEAGLLDKMKIPAKSIRDMRAKYQDEIKRKAQRKIEEMAEEKVNELLEAELDKIVESIDFSKLKISARK